MVRVICLGTTASFFFSSLYLLNRLMSMEQGHWAWTAAIRYFYLAVFLAILVGIRSGFKIFPQIWKTLTQHWRFWIFATSPLMFGGYAASCFAVCHAPAWIVSATFQVNIVATPLVLAVFRKPVPKRGIAFSLIVFLGAILVNFDRANDVSLNQILLGGVPMLLSSITVPLLWQMVWETQHQSRFPWIPHIPGPLMKSAHSRLLVMTLATMPLIIVMLLILLVASDLPPKPNQGQLFHTATNALLSGIIGLSIYLHVRHASKKSYEIAALDSTSASQILFVFICEIALLGGGIPSALGISGFLFIVLGVSGYLFSNAPPEPAPAST